MLKTKYFRGFLLLLSILFIFVLFIPYSIAFKNNGGRSGTSFARTPQVYKNDYYRNNGYQYFGTHDWITESALILLYENYEIEIDDHPFINYLYINRYDLKMYFLLGTEAPDTNKYSQISLTDCSGNPYGTINIKDRTGSHHIYFDGISVTDDFLAWNAQYCYNMATEALAIDHDCKKAAFFLGAMCHYIGDCASYGHLIRPDDVGGRSIWQSNKGGFEERISRLTCRIESQRGYQLSTDFFSIQPAREEFMPILKEWGWFAAYKTGLFVDSHLITEDETLKWWLWREYEESRDYYFPSGWKSNCYDWDRTTFNSFNTLKRTYFSNVEKCLNKAILYCSVAINSAADSYDSCNCRKKKGTLQDHIDDAAANELATQMTFMVMSIVAVPITLFSIATLKKI